MSQRIVLIGSAGFVGSNLLKYLGGFEISTPSEHDVDLTNPESLCRAISPGDVVLNAAGYANATDFTDRGRALFQAVNVDGVRNLAEAAARQQAAQLVHISSVAAMGRLNREGITEEMSLPVTTPYAKSKLEGELILREWSEKLPVTILRPTSVFGEGRGLAHLLCKIACLPVVPLPGGGKARIPFTYIGNIAKAVELTIGNPGCFGRTFIVGDEESYSLHTIVRGLAAAMGKKPRIIGVPVSASYLATLGLERASRLLGRAPVFDRGRLETLTTTVSYSIDAIKSATGFRPPYSLEESLQRIADWYLQHP